MTICFQTILGLIRWKTTSIFWKMEDDLKKIKMEDNLKNFKNGRLPQFKANGRWPNFFQKQKTTQKNKKMEDDLINFNKKNLFSIPIKFRGKHFLFMRITFFQPICICMTTIQTIQKIQKIYTVQSINSFVELEISQPVSPFQYYDKLVKHLLLFPIIR
jgi:hypothetical protein